MSEPRRVAGLLLLGALVVMAAGFWLLRGAFEGAPVDAAGAIDILIERDEIYSIGAADLHTFGWEDVDPGDLRLEARGEPYPFHVQGSGSDFRIVFYGRGPAASESRYTPDNVYRLYRDGHPELTLRHSTETEAGPASPDAASRLPVEISIEENALYLPALEDGRPWFWQQLAAPGDLEIEFDLPGYAGGEAILSIELFSTTEAEEIDPDHHLAIQLNGSLVADQSWDGRGSRSIDFNAPEDLLNEEGNRLTIEAPGDTGVAADIVALDRITVRYDRTADVTGEQVDFTADFESVRVAFSGGHALFVFEIVSGSSTPEMRIYSGDPEITIPTTGGVRYAIGEADDLAQPAGLRAAELEPDLRANPGADYLAIGDPALLEPLGPLLEHREAEGLATLAVSLQTVYDQFGGGLRTPEAIRSFLAQAVESWVVKPRYVLLVGDWTFDPYEHTASAPEFALPSFFLYTEYGGETVSDVAYTLLDGDALPDLALGRIPARSPEQVETVVAKTLAFEAASGGDWRVLAAADGSERRFSTDAANFLEGFEGRYEPVQVDQTGDGRSAAARIIEELDRDVLIFSYFGHGSLTQFGKDSLFTHEDAESLANGEPAPILVSITCLAGMFTHPAVESLTETMLWNAGGGAAAGLSATSLTLPQFQSFLSEALVDELVRAPGGRLGDALLNAQRRMPLDLGPGAAEVLGTFLLFGDPALVVP